MSASSAFQGLVHEFNRREIAPYKNRYVRGTFSESRRPDRVSAQAIIQVTAEAPLLDLTTEVMIGCGNQTYIYLDRLCSTYPLKLTFLQDA